MLTGLLHGDLPVLSTHILVEVVRPAHRLLLSLLRLLLVPRHFGRLIEVTNTLLVILHFSLGVEPLVALDDMVVCRVGRFKATEEDVVLIKLMSLNLLLIDILEAADGADVHLSTASDGLLLLLLMLLLGHVVVLLLLHHHC